jgi:hypothetical protein
MFTSANAHNHSQDIFALVHAKYYRYIIANHLFAGQRCSNSDGVPLGKPDYLQCLSVPTKVDWST